jgi:tetratricopeptide (TPR) repeat protein
MDWRQALVPVGLLVVPATLLGAWLVMRDDPPPPRSSPRPTSESVAPSDEPTEDDAAAPRPRPRAKKRARPTAPPARGTIEDDGERDTDEGYDRDVEAEHNAAPEYKRAAEQLKEGDHAGALESAEKCLEADPEHRGCWDDKLRAHLMAGDLDKAEALAAACHEGREDVALCHGADVALALQRGDASTAGKSLEVLEDQAPKSRFTIMARAEVHKQRGEEKTAAVNFTLACLRGHLVACAEVPGAKKAGGE